MSAAPFFDRPLWQVGFRPFFPLAALAGVVLPLVWAIGFAWPAALPPSPLGPLQWHAHEMFYGFGWAVLGGFLLTATKNWVQTRGVHGGLLAALALLWLLERLVVSFGAGLPAPLFVLGANLFLPGIVAAIVWTLVRYRRQDSFPDNYFFLIALPAFLVAKNLLLLPGHFDAGVAMTLALFRVAFLVMLERTISGFMSAAFQVRIPLDPRLDTPIKGLAVVLVATPWLPPALASGVALLLAVLLTVRFARWSPHLGLSRLDVGIMYLGYLAIVAQLVSDAWAKSFGAAWVGSVGVHLFSFGPMGLIIPAMLVRISKGHTGRRVVFEPADRAALWLMLTGLVFRVVAPQFWPAAYPTWIGLSAACWAACFGSLLWRFLPFYLAPRADGRPH